MIQEIVRMFSDLFVMENLPFLILGLLGFFFWMGYIILREKNNAYKKFNEIQELETFRNERMLMEKELRRENFELGSNVSLNEKLEKNELPDLETMKLIDLTYAKDGMLIGKSIIIEGQNALMKKGTKLTKERIRKLKEWGVHHVWIMTPKKKSFLV